MSLSEYSSATFSPRGHARKLVSVHLSDSSESEESAITRRTIERLRDFFAARADVADKDSLLSSIDQHLQKGVHDEIVTASLTRRQRKEARRLGFAVKYQGHSAPEA